MKSFNDFEAWIEETGISRQIGELASAVAVEYIDAGKANSLSEEQQEVVFNLALRISSQVAAGTLKSYHAWLMKEEEEEK